MKFFQYLTIILISSLSRDIHGAQTYFLRQLTESNYQDETPLIKKPIIYTFFEIKELPNGEKHERDIHEEMINIWTQLWTDAGWEPRILTLEDARKHPDFNLYRNGITVNEEAVRTPYTVFENSYDYMCFMRWLAMAAHGKGGWMSDYDTFPMGITFVDGFSMPNGGVFTGYERHVPSLLSGSAHEWDRMSQMVLDMAVKKIRDEKKEIYSDMYALYDVIQQNEHEFIREMKVFMGYPYKEAHVVDCHLLKNYMVVHLSHMRTAMAVESGIVEAPNGQYSENIRPQLASLLHREWKEQCFEDISFHQ